MTDLSQFRLSASAISAFKACPTRFRLAYREGIRRADDTDAQRVGTNWHAMHEVYHNAFANHIHEQASDQPHVTEVECHQFEEDARSAALQAAVNHLNQVYVDTPLPSTKTVTEWAVEQQVLTQSLVGYYWFWQADPVEALASEQAFDLPLKSPLTGMPLPIEHVVRLGKIDHVIKWRGMVGNMERKSTSRSIEPGSDYWDKATKDTQVSMYALAFRDLRAMGLLAELGVGAERVGNTLYDVWHKPTIKPCFLSQAATKLLIETGMYCGVKFDVVVRGTIGVDFTLQIDVNGAPTELKLGATKAGKPEKLNKDGSVKTPATPDKPGAPAIRETPEMYGARLLEDITTRPEFYFQRKEIARTQQELDRFEKELYNIYQAQKTFSQTGCYFENEQQCRATFPCEFIPICYGPGADSVCDGVTVPDGFQRKTVDLTINETDTDGE